MHLLCFYWGWNCWIIHWGSQSIDLVVMDSLAPAPDLLLSLLPLCVSCPYLYGPRHWNWVSHLLIVQFRLRILLTSLLPADEVRITAIWHEVQHCDKVYIERKPLGRRKNEATESAPDSSESSSRIGKLPRRQGGKTKVTQGFRAEVQRIRFATYETPWRPPEDW